ncbi:hypothetical protein VOLCADRAFT_121509 [Volvox carteri f. nagariensis]|uniref:Amidohydrolase-related domain-containing protein n=1 Tax=Volvox carteri f. nagariensis TaxID=3068 RepID=D8UCE2_VOLCA|nr:uncharacterized protein VOLCADRAFT_121509 [Volvox carteri f. nagariensis]EFJ42682.1 hypothetical protein VOLCADRAFT_121509 [Volvox carteri f. nagariensis]|eukprot:XP_002956333.1 hypothetical protein VOLCADRAFT_121509 [Volvox carteri f. nagariensis]
MLQLRLPNEWPTLPFSSTEGDQPKGADNDDITNIMPEELCFSSFARACAARRALQRLHAHSFPSAASGSSPPAPKKPRLHSDSQMPPTPAAVDAAATGGPDPAMSLQPAAAASSPPQEFSLLLTNCRVLDVAAGNYLEGLQSVLLQGGLIREVRPMGHAGATTTVTVAAAESADAESADAESADAESADAESADAESADAESADAESADAESADAESADAESADAESADAEAEAGIAPIEGFRTHPPTAVEVDCGGAVLMPGLCDAHVHCTAVTANLAGLMSLPESYVSTKAAHILAGMLARGFTTVRDAGGADFGLAQAVEEGLVLGPRILFTGHALSQTGGHGDFRGRGEEMCACGAALRGIGRVCDGDAEVMASGGVASPTDRLTNTQFSEAELKAIVEEAGAAGTYVCAHAYTPAAIQRAVKCGVASIEHGNYLDEYTARLMSHRRVFLVPTLVTYREIVRHGTAAGMPEKLVAKVGDAVDAGLRSLSIADKAKVPMCFGSDLLGNMHPAQAGEFELRARVLPSASILRSATVNCAALFGMKKLGQVRPGYRADLLLLRPGLDPLADVAVLAAPGGGALAMEMADAPANQQNDPGLHDGLGGNPPGGEPSTAGDAESFIMPEMTEMLSNLQAFFSNHCIPRARAVETEVANLQYEINGVTDRAEAEKSEALNELNRLGKLVLNFQSRISQLLQFDPFGGQR